MWTWELSEDQDGGQLLTLRISPEIPQTGLVLLLLSLNRLILSLMAVTLPDSQLDGDSETDSDCSESSSILQNRLTDLEEPWDLPNSN